MQFAIAKSFFEKKLLTKLGESPTLSTCRISNLEIQNFQNIEKKVTNASQWKILVKTFSEEIWQRSPKLL